MKMKILPEIQSRFSPMKFVAGKSIDRTDWETILEAGRWAPSAFNEQPWRLIWADSNHPGEFGTFISLLSEYNQQWAADASILMVVIASERFIHNGKSNPHAWYDTGMAIAQMVIQASSMGIQAHQMGGFDADKAKKLLAIPTDYDPISVAAFGFPDEVKNVLPPFKERAEAVRSRMPSKEFCFKGTFGKSSQL
jgi:nitroreductase